MSRQRHILAIIFSVIGHIALLWVILATPQVQTPENQSFESQNLQNQMEFELIAKNIATELKQDSKTAFHAIRKYLTTQPSLPTVTPPSAQNFANSWSYLPDPMDFSSGSRKEQDFYSKLWAAVDNNLKEDPLLSEYNHTGVIFVFFELTASGNFIPQNLKVSAEDAILKVRSMRAIRQGLKNLHPADLPQKTVPCNMRFSWIDRTACHRQGKINKEFLSFCRHAVNNTRDHSTIGRAAALAGTFIKNGPFGFAENYQQYKQENWRHDSRFDPFESEKNDPDFQLQSSRAGYLLR